MLGHHRRRHHGFFEHIRYHLGMKNYRLEQRSARSEGFYPPQAIPAIDSDRCAGCGSCKKACPSTAIEGEKNRPYWIDPRKCTQCGICYNHCRRGAIYTCETSLDDSLKKSLQAH
jgi:ferredoxin